MKKQLIILVPLTICLIAFFVANRAPVKLVLNPFTLDKADAFSLKAPFFVWMFIFVAIGILCTSIRRWLRRNKH